MDSARAGIRILHLEDSPDDSLFVSRALEKAKLSFELRRVEAREDFVRELAQFSPHLILSDHSLPGFDSRAALEIVRRERPDLPLILVSGALGDELAVEAMKCGAVDYVLKDRLARLPAAVERALELSREREDRKRAEERYALAVRGANDGIWDWDLRTKAMFFSERWKAMAGLPPEAPVATADAWHALVHPDDVPRLRQALQAHFDGTSPHFECEYRLKHADGSWRWMLARGLAIPGSGGRPSRIAGSQTDITERKRAEEALLRHAYFDVLTGLPNRALFENRVQRAMRVAQRRGSGFAILFLDIDRFKVVNDSLGHGAGDRLLALLARRLEETLRPGDTAARFGGDEFAVLVEDVAGPQEALRIGERVQAAMRAPFAVGNRDIAVGVSIGIALAARGYASPEAMIRDADAAMYRAKERGRGRCEVFDEQMHARSLECLSLEQDLRRALENGELRLHFQPVVELATGRITGFEALVRWQHPSRGLLTPSQFIPLAEEAGLIVQVDAWVLQAACRQVRTWVDDGLPPLDLSVNLSAQQFVHRDLVETVSRALDAFRLEPARLKLELTESVLMASADQAALAIRDLRAVGVRLAVDDFGTGYSSLAYLKHFQVATLKIDRSFVRDVTTNPDDAAIASAIISMAHRLRLNVTAEGVETAAQRDFLRAERCDEGQGFLFGRPWPAEEVPGCLRRVMIPNA